MKVEHFIIAGAQRCGTTLLARVLDQHPQIYLAKPLRPEPKFFLSPELYEKGLRHYRKQYFSDAPAGSILGEKSTSYIEYGAAANAIAQLLPQARIIFILRDPIERAISNYWFSRNEGVETEEMGRAFCEEQGRSQSYDSSLYSVSPYAYLQRGRYIEYLREWDRHFAPSQVRIIQFEKLIREEYTFEGVFRFLGADPDFRPILPEGRLNRSEKGPHAMTTELRRYLERYFAECNSELAERYGIDLSLWRTNGPADSV